jgi:hypothetical protein
MAKLLIVVTLRKAILVSVGLDLNCNMTEARELEYFQRFSVLGKVMRKKGRIFGWEPSAFVLRLEDIYLTLTTSYPSSVIASEISLAGVTEGRCLMTALTGLRDLEKNV